MDWVSKGSFKGDLEMLDKSGKGVGKIYVAVKFERPGERYSATSKRERAKNIFCRSNVRLNVAERFRYSSHSFRVRIRLVPIGSSRRPYRHRNCGGGAGAVGGAGRPHRSPAGGCAKVPGRERSQQQVQRRWSEPARTISDWKRAKRS